MRNVLISFVSCIHSVIDDEQQARRCLNLQTNQTDLTTQVPLPVVLKSTIEDGGFICKNKLSFYSFSCSVYGSDLVWYFNNEIVTAFLPFDSVGTIFRRSYPALAPIYTITTILTEQASMSFEGYMLQLVTSILTVQLLNENQAEPIPFTVSCQAHCEDTNFTEICQSKRVKIAGLYTASRPLQIKLLYPTYDVRKSKPWSGQNGHL